MSLTTMLAIVAYYCAAAVAGATGATVIGTRPAWYRDLCEHARAFAADIMGSDPAQAHDPWEGTSPSAEWGPADEPTMAVPRIRTRGKLADPRLTWPLRTPRRPRHIPQHYTSDNGVPTPTLLARRLSAGWQLRARSAVWWPQTEVLA